MNTTDKNSQNGAPTANGNAAAPAKPAGGDGHENSENAGRRSDENRLHVRNHGILTRNLLQALVERGENPRVWRDFIRELHGHLQVEDPLAEMYFDRWCADIMREALITNAERAIFVAKDEGPEFDARVRQAITSAQFTNSTNVNGQQSLDLLQHLSIIQRYQSQCRREFNRNLGALLALRDGGPNALARFLNKTAAKKDSSRESD